MSTAAASRGPGRAVQLVQEHGAVYPFLQAAVESQPTDQNGDMLGFKHL